MTAMLGEDLRKVFVLSKKYLQILTENQSPSQAEYEIQIDCFIIIQSVMGYFILPKNIIRPNKSPLRARYLL